MIAGCSFLRKHSARFYKTAEVNVTSLTSEIGQNQDITSDSEEETDFTDLTVIWSRRRSVRAPRRMEDFL